MIFPGMDPYLEHPHFWPGVHASLIVYARDQLQPCLMPRYVATIEERVYVEGPDREVVPDLRIGRTQPIGVPSVRAAMAVVDEPIVVTMPRQEIHETYIEILDRETDMRVVTVIEIVSATNKAGGAGRESYVKKQEEVLASGAHLVEIDLLRTGSHVLAVNEWLAREQAPYDYLVSINRAVGTREKFELYPRTLRQPLPKIRIPLAGSDPDVRLDIPAIVSQAWEAGAYSQRMKYHAACVPALPPEDQAWADELIRQSTSNPGSG